MDINSLKPEENPNNLIETYSSLQKYMIPIKSKEDINVEIIGLLVEFLDYSILERLEQTINKITSNKSETSKIIELFEELYIQVM